MIHIPKRDGIVMETINNEEKRLVVTMVDGSTHHMPLQPIIDSYKKIHSDNDCPEPDGDDLVDWFSNSMNWEEVEPHLKHVKHGAPDYEEHFNQCDFDATIEVSDPPYNSSRTHIYPWK